MTWIMNTQLKTWVPCPSGEQSEVKVTDLQKLSLFTN